MTCVRSVWMSLLFLLLSSCIVPATFTTLTPSQPVNDVTPEIVSTTVENPAAIGPDHFAAGINPLTGQPVADPASLNRRPLLVKISNAPPLVRPQAGIGAADLVFEHYAEGGLTRFSDRKSVV